MNGSWLKHGKAAVIAAAFCVATASQAHAADYPDFDDASVTARTEEVIKERSNSDLINKFLEQQYKQAETERIYEYEAQATQQRNLYIFSLLGAIILFSAIIVWLLIRSRRNLQSSNDSLQRK